MRLCGCTIIQGDTTKQGALFLLSVAASASKAKQCVALCILRIAHACTGLQAYTIDFVGLAHQPATWLRMLLKNYILNTLTMNVC